jgi:hypothetical protein
VCPQFDSRSDAEIRLWRVEGATNKNKDLRYFCKTFFFFGIDYKVTTKGSEWGVFGVVDYNPYYKMIVGFNSRVSTITNLLIKSLDGVYNYRIL